MLDSYNPLNLNRSMAGAAPDIAQNAVLVPSGDLPVDPIEVKGYDFNDGIDYGRILKTFATTGFQATHFAKAVNEINRMVRYTIPYFVTGIL